MDGGYQLRLVEGGEPVQVYPPEVRSLADTLHDAGYLDMAERVLKAYTRYEQTVQQAQFVLRQEIGK